MARGLVVVATNVGGISSVIENNKNGVIINPHQTSEIINSIIKIIIDKNFRDYLVENGYKLVFNVTFENESLKFISILRKYIQDYDFEKN